MEDHPPEFQTFKEKIHFIESLHKRTSVSTSSEEQSAQTSSPRHDQNTPLVPPRTYQKSIKKSASTEDQTDEVLDVFVYTENCLKDKDNERCNYENHEVKSPSYKSRPATLPKPKQRVDTADTQPSNGGSKENQLVNTLQRRNTITITDDECGGSSYQNVEILKSRDDEVRSSVEDCNSEENSEPTPPPLPPKHPKKVSSGLSPGGSRSCLVPRDAQSGSENYIHMSLTPAATVPADEGENSIYDEVGELYGNHKDSLVQDHKPSVNDGLHQKKNLSKQQSLPKASSLLDIDLLMIGKTGNGKSALGNSILGRNAFASRSSSTSVTKTVSDEVTEYNGRIIKVVDGPGVGDTDMTDEDAKHFVVDNLSYAISINPRGYHAILLVVKFGERFTRDNRMTIEVLKKVFGESFISKYCILVMTHGDLLDRGVTFEEWTNDQKGELADLIKECGGRVVLFDNRTEDKDKMDKQINQLLDIVHGMIFENCRYTNDQFVLAKSTREVMMLESKKHVIEDEAMNEASLIVKKLQDIQADADNTDHSMSLEQLLSRTIHLYERLEDRDMNTGVLKDLLHHIESIENAIKDEIRLAHRISQLIEKFNKEDGCKSQAFVQRIKSRKSLFQRGFKDAQTCQGEIKDQKLLDNADSYPDLSGQDSRECEETMKALMEKTNALEAGLKKMKKKNNKTIFGTIQGTICSALKSILKEK